jgi:XTP/dITP diphosphohydrolase
MSWILTFATRNPDKTREVQEILGADFAVQDLLGRADLPETAETGATFEENAILKATVASRHVAGLMLADDSGLEVDVLNLAPGVRSARYAGEQSDDVRNLVKLLRDVQAVDPNADRREARFQCVLAIARAGELLATFPGTAEGHIVDTPSGAGGFGYDPIFVPVGFAQTFADLTPTIKNIVSHRGRALTAALPFLRAELQTS